MILHQAVDRQILDADNTEPINNLTAVLMGEVLTLPCNRLMDTHYDLAMLTALWRAVRLCGVLR